MKLYRVLCFEEGMEDYEHLDLVVADNEKEAEKKIIEEYEEDSEEWDLLFFEVKIEGYKIKIEKTGGNNE